ncbi:zonular occludens toxin domain-containing protein [Vibrio sagamiensis]|uniref:Toxin n=1 Tax=Vibrio sagamiensis NBRC 104589 TaxID=1219064 RepID=A0A511QJN1_9VIBR|nr:zonular occludens toxin domain-containing protein [Vibrio sagamiensis]PNQ58991.1 toxin [Vibrio agarivorans]GEM77534.1 toxin [Vibrio sagamiensis NBRC 104589]
MAITIRTGGNGSYKSAYTAWFSILPALKAGRVVVTNLEGMEPLHVIEERLNIQFPSSTKLIRIFSRSEVGIDLWQHFFCWCPLNSLIVIDECQDIFSKNVGFDGRKIKHRPLEEFLPHLPDWYSEFFHSRHVPVDMTTLKESEVDDLGCAEYDSQGRIIYPLTYNEGFMRHRKYNWDIELLSPDWQQIDSSIKACAEQAFFHKNRDKMFFAKRKPYIYQHPVNVTKPVIPTKKDAGLFTQKIPLEAHLLYKSTGTGAITKSGGLNPLFKSPKFLFTLFIIFSCMGYFCYVAFDLLSQNESPVSTNEPKTQTDSQVVQSGSVPSVKEDHQSIHDISGRGDHHSNSEQGRPTYVPVKEILYFEGLESAYLSGFHSAKKTVVVKGKSYVNREYDVIINIYASDGLYSVNQKYLEAVGVKFEVIHECLMILKQDDRKSLLTCEPSQPDGQIEEVETDFAQLEEKRSKSMTDNSYLM